MIFCFFFLFISGTLTLADEEGNRNSTLVSPALTSKILKELRFYNLIQTDKCISILIIRAIESFSKMYVIIPKSEPNERLAKNLQKRFLNSIFTDPDKFINTKLSFDFQLFLFYDNFTIEEIIKSREPSLRVKFLVIVKSYNEVIKNLQEFWKYKIVDVVVTYAINSTAYYYTYFPYSKNHCGEMGKPVLLAECDLKKGKFSEKVEGFSPKADNLHGCPINITFSSITPAVFFSGSKLTGMEIEIMDELMLNMNGVPNYILNEPEEVRYGIKKGYKDLLEKSEIAGGAALSLTNVMETDFFAYGQSACVTWAVPVQTFRKMRYSYNIFPISIWILITASLLIMSIVYKIFNKSNSAVTFNLLSLLLDTPIRSDLTPRILFTLWLWFSFMITATYRGAFQSKLLAVEVPQQLHTTKEIFNSNLSISGYSELLEEILPVISQNFTIDPSRLTQVNLKNYIQENDKRKNTAYLGLREILLYHVAKNNLAYYIYIQKNCIVHYHLIFVLRKNSHLTKTIGTIANRLTENGFTSYLYKKYFYQPSGQITQEEYIKYLQQHPLKLDFYKLGIVFIIFILGIITSIITFILELLKLL